MEPDAPRWLVKKIRAADLFCGAGGTSTGLLRAAARMGRDVELLAVNHWQDAISTHELNHPGVRHLRGDLEAIDPRVAVPGGELDLLLASPECTSHSYSRGGRPISEQSRSTAWCPLKWCDQLNVKAFVIENVPAFRQWGPTNRNGRPIAARTGETYRQWLDMFRALGYTVDVRILNAADYGAATTRRRCYIIGVKGTRKVRWPEPTHAPGGVLLGRRQWRGAKEIIDWSLEGKSIFNRTKPLAPKTRERILMGAEKFWPALRPYLAILRNHMGARDVNEPVPTLAAGGQHMGLVEPILVTVSHSGGGTGSRELGVADAVIVQVAHGDGGGRGNKGRTSSVEAPLGTVTGSPNHALAQAFLTSAGGSWEDRPQSINDPVRPILGTEPLQTITTAPGTVALVQPFGAGGVTSPFLVSYYANGHEHSVEAPIGTLTAKPRYGLVTPHGIQLGEDLYLDIRFRMLRPHELAAAMGFPKGYQFTGTVDAQVKQIGNAVEVNQAEALCFTVLA